MQGFHPSYLRGTRPQFASYSRHPHQNSLPESCYVTPSPESQSTHEIAEARGNPLFNFRSVLHNTADPFRRVVHSVIRPQIVRTPRDHIHSGDVISIYSFLAIQRPSLPPSPFPYREWTVAAAILVSYIGHFTTWGT